MLNLNWETPRFSPADVLGDPKLEHYTRLVPDRGDFGFVAEIDGRWVGVVWLLFLPEHDPGYGFVKPDVPELSVCVKPGYRGPRHRLEARRQGARCIQGPETGSGHSER